MGHSRSLGGSSIRLQAGGFQKKLQMFSDCMTTLRSNQGAAANSHPRCRLNDFMKLDRNCPFKGSRRWLSLSFGIRWRRARGWTGRSDWDSP